MQYLDIFQKIGLCLLLHVIRLVSCLNSILYRLYTLKHCEFSISWSGKTCTRHTDDLLPTCANGLDHSLVAVLMAAFTKDRQQKLQAFSCYCMSRSDELAKQLAKLCIGCIYSAADLNWAHLNFESAAE